LQHFDSSFLFPRIKCAPHQPFAMLCVLAISLLSLTNAFDVDCSLSACPETCSCTTTRCLEPMNKCLDDADCAKLRDCPMQCGCGDQACLLECAGRTSSPLATPLAECIQSQCHSNLLKTSARDVDCSASKCEDACQCSVDKCGDSIDACLADSECSKVQDCAMTCECGDDACMLGCAANSKSALAEPVAQCVASECHVEAMLRSSAPNLSCHGAACEDVCRCAKGKCLGVGMACLLDPHCASFQDCSFKCPCGDAQCAINCANGVSSSKAMPLANCIEQKCHHDRMV